MGTEAELGREARGGGGMTLWWCGDCGVGGRLVLLVVVSE